MDSWNRGDWLSLAQTVTATIAVVAAIGVVFVQQWLQRRELSRNENAQDKAIIQVMASLASEIGRVCHVCSSFPDGNDGSMVFYADPKQEFRELRQLLSELPLDRVNRREVFQVLVDLRTIASKGLKIINADDVTRFSWKGTRNEFSTLVAESRGYAAHLTDIADKIKT